MADNKDKAQQGKQDPAAQGGAGSMPQDGGNMQNGGQNVQGGQNAQSGGADSSRQSGFLHSSPEANVFPKGHSQSDNSTRSGGGDSAAGTPDEGRLGGSGGTSAAGTTGNDPDR